MKKISLKMGFDHKNKPLCSFVLSSKIIGEHLTPCFGFRPLIKPPSNLKWVSSAKLGFDRQTGFRPSNWVATAKTGF